MKKVGIITSNTSFANNYGAVLQCYALCGQLRKWGLDPYVINYAYKNQGVEITTTTKTKRSVLSRINYILSQDVSVSQKVQYRLMRNKREKMRRQFLDFCDTHISFHSETPSDFSELEKNPPDYEYFITGSDQVWNPVIHGNRNDKGCFLQFAPPVAKRIAYAPSFGIKDYPKELEASLGQYLSSFHFISVREYEGQKIIKNACGIEAPVVLDPTLMADPDIYSEISDCPIELPNKYILCYRFGRMPYATKIIKQASKALKLPVVELPLSIESYGKGSRLCFDIDPSLFIGAIKGAELVLTDSFHCTVFSILSHTPFYTFLRQADDEKNNMNGRMKGLLEELHLEKRLITPKSAELFYFDLDMEEEFSMTEMRLYEMRAVSQNYLKNALS